MKKSMFFAIVIMFALGINTATAATADTKKADKIIIASTSENVLSAEEMNLLTLRVEEIRDMDKSDMTALEKRELRNELKVIKKDMRGSGAIYIGTGTLILIIILIILLV
jgi:uncharacterized ferredoxin-like protein